MSLKLCSVSDCNICVSSVIVAREEAHSNEIMLHKKVPEQTIHLTAISEKGCTNVPVHIQTVKLYRCNSPTLIGHIDCLEG